jgi:poly(3-hydroxybutyrate) depolymerase
MTIRFVVAALLAALTAGCGSDDTSGTATQPEPYPAPAPDDCITSVEPGHQTLTCEGLSFELTVPAVCLERACGLIVDVHGFGMNGTLMELHTKLSVLAEAPGYIVVQPSAPGAVLASSWNPAHDAQVFAIMQRVMSVWHVDRKRIHFDGYSQGGWMTWRFICAHSDLIASAAPIAAGSGGQSCAFDASNRPAREMPIFYTHGTTDGLVNFSGATAQRDALIAGWGMQEKEVLMSGADHRWTRYENANGTVFEFAQHDWECSFSLGATALRGHCFPGSGDFLGCGATNPWNWGAAVLDFFIRHPLP